jgi:hypothetical protein
MNEMGKQDPSVGMLAVSAAVGPVPQLALSKMERGTEATVAAAAGAALIPTAAKRAAMANVECMLVIGLGSWKLEAE